jgi:hypothetical protein
MTVTVQVAISCSGTSIRRIVHDTGLMIALTGSCAASMQTGVEALLMTAVSPR